MDTKVKTEQIICRNSWRASGWRRARQESTHYGQDCLPSTSKLPQPQGRFETLGRYVEVVVGIKTSLKYQSVRFQAIGAKGLAGYYEFEPFSAVS